METVKILEKPTTINWDYDEEADVLYLSIGEPQPAVGMGELQTIKHPRLLPRYRGYSQTIFQDQATARFGLLGLASLLQST